MKVFNDIFVTIIKIKRNYIMHLSKINKVWSYEPDDKIIKIKEYLKKDDKIGITKRGITSEQYEELCECIYKECNIDINRVGFHPEDFIILRIHPENYKYWYIPDDIKPSLSKRYYGDVIYDYLRENNLPIDSFGYILNDSLTKEFVEGFFLAVDILKQNT
jgi:hypothetical protein